MNGAYHSLDSVLGWDAGLLGLMYHAIEPPPLRHSHRGLFVAPTLLERQLNELQQAEVDFLSLSEWLEQRSADARQVIVTFDDAFRHLRDNALPILTKLRIPAITYVVAGNIGGTNSWDRGSGAQVCPLMDRADLLAWQQAGLEIGSHGMTHVHLTRLPIAQARAEIVDSRKKLEDLTGRPVRHFCYPYGDLNPSVRDLVAEAGYATATTIRPSISGPDTDPLLIGRHLASHRKPYRAALRGAVLRSLGISPRRATAAAS